MSSQKELFMQAIAKALPPEHKDKVPQYVEVMDEYFNGTLQILEKAHKDERLPPQLRIGSIRRMLVGIASAIYFTEGLHSLMECAKSVAMNIQMEKAERKLKEARNGNVKS